MWNLDQLQGECSLRAVYPANLRAMCARISGMCHRFSVERITKRFAYVVYSNPNEYGTERPMTALYPVMPDGRIVLDVHDVKNDSWDGEGWQAFEQLRECPQLWRSAPDKDDWRTREEIEATRSPRYGN